MHELLLLSASEIARRIRAGQVTSIEAVEAHIERVQTVNPRLNAVVRDRFDQARAEAEQADGLLRSTRKRDGLPFFHGVPCGIKECFALRGMPNTAGLVSRRNRRVIRDATAVERYRGAGLIPLGVTNTSELCMWMESNNRLYGRTRNPYDPERIVGGSSGGEGALVGAGGAPAGLGSDIGGSIRMPAFFNGVFGHKPTGGLVPGSGQFPMASPGAASYLTTGPLTRRAEDLYPLMRVLAGPDGRDPACRPMPLRDPAKVRLENLRVINTAGNGFLPVSRRLREAQARVAEHLASRNMRVREERPRDLKYSLDIWSSMLQQGQDIPFAVMMGEGRDVGGARELLKWFTGRSTHTLPAISLALLEKLTALMKTRSQKFIRKGQALQRELISLLGEDGVMLYPSYPMVAPRHNIPLLLPVMWVYTAIFNVMEFPVTQVPLGLDDRGLPLGIQVVAGPGNDHLTMAVALELEKQFGGWSPPHM